MTFRADQVSMLTAPLKREDVKTRQQAGRNLSYIEGWHAIAEANRIFGHDGWDRETTETRMVAEREVMVGKSNPQPGWSVTYVAKVRVTAMAGDRRIVREGTGTGSGIDRDLGQAHESAIKEAETDAMKRALITFGWPFGLALYDKSQENVESDKAPSKQEEPDDSADADRLIMQFSDFTSQAQMVEWANDQKRFLDALSQPQYERVLGEWRKKLDLIKARVAKARNGKANGHVNGSDAHA